MSLFQPPGVAGCHFTFQSSFSPIWLPNNVAESGALVVVPVKSLVSPVPIPEIDKACHPSCQRSEMDQS